MTTEKNKIETTVVSLQDAMSGNIPAKKEEPITPVEPDIKNDGEGSGTPAEQPVVQKEPKVDEPGSPDLKPELKDEDAVAFLKSKGIEIDSLEDLKKQPEVKQVNPYEDILDDDDKAYLKFKKETGRSRKEFEALNIDYDKVSSIELAREKVRKDTGLNLTDEQIDEYIANELGVDLSDELSASDTIKLASYVKSFRDEKKSEQEKYRQPKETTQKESKTEPEKSEYVRLENGSVMKKTDYEKLVYNHQQYVAKNKEAVNSVTESKFSIKVDDNGSERELTYSYEFADNDRHSMVSITADTTAYVNKTYQTENGFNHKQFNEDMFWANQKNREKAISDLLHKARAEAKEEVLEERGNVSLDPQKELQKQEKQGVKYVPVDQIFSGNHY